MQEDSLPASTVPGMGISRDSTGRARAKRHASKSADVLTTSSGPPVNIYLPTVYEIEIIIDKRQVHFVVCSLINNNCQFVGFFLFGTYVLYRQVSIL